MSIGEIAIGIVIGAAGMATLLRSTLKNTIAKWEEEIKAKGVKEYLEKK